MMNKKGGNDPYANQQQSNNRGGKPGRGANQQEISFDNNSSYDSEMDNSMDASAFVNRHCNFAEASMMASELGQSANNNQGGWQ